MKIPVGEFNNSENEFFKNTLILNAVDEPLTTLRDNKTYLMMKEIGKIDVALGALDKTIKNIYIDVKLKVDKSTYDMWMNRVNSASNSFKKLYSDANNSLYNHFYKMSGIENNAWTNILSDVEWLKNNVFVKCERNMCKECKNCSALNMGIVSDRDKAGNKSELKESENVQDFVEGFEEDDLSNFFKIKGNNGKRCNNNGETNDVNTKRKKGIQGDGENIIEEQTATGSAAYEDISDDESAMIDDILLQNVDDEVGTVDLNPFNEFIEKYVNDK